MLNFFSKKSFSSLFLMFICVILLASCASPKPLLRLNIKETQKFRDWQGKEVVTLEKDSVKMMVFFDQKSYSSRHFAVNFSFTNLSSKDIIIQPDTFYYKTEATKKFSLIQKDGYLYNLSASTVTLLPSFVAQAMNPAPMFVNNVAKKSAEIANAQYLGKPLTSVQVLKPTFSRQLTRKIIKKTTSRKIRRQNKNILQNTIKETLYYQAINTINNQKDNQKDNQKNITGFMVENMRNAPLQKTMLGQNEEISGKVWFPFLPDYNIILTLVIEVNGIKFEVPYTQTIITESPNIRRKSILD